MIIKKIEVKNISYYARGSEETPCYNATVYINGKKAVEVSNDGHGGSDRQDVWHENGFNLNAINEWCIKTYGKKTHSYNSNGENKSFTYDYGLESLCQDALYDWLDSKALKKDFKNKYLFLEDGKLMAYKKSPKDTDVTFKQFFEKEHPQNICLNFLPFEKALELYKGAK
tara:strand:+ start:411 stop:920 length:510 start_codon:yes stop_codon:yes gene_type:complete